MKIIKKYFWQILSTFLALVAIFATYNVFYLDKPQKEIQIVSDPPVSLVEVKPEAKPDIHVFYRDEPVTNLFLYQFQIRNSGDQPVTEEDYSRPLTFSFPNGFQIADVAITESEPINIGMIVEKISENEFRANSILLNPDDTVSVRIILIGDESEITEEALSVDGRILGVKEVKRVSASKQGLPDWLFFALGVITPVVSNIIIKPAISKAASLLKNLRKPRENNHNDKD